MIAVASGKHETLMRDLGVDQFIDYNKTPVSTAVRGVDLVFDTVGGKEASRFLKTIRRGGALFLFAPAAPSSRRSCPSSMTEPSAS